jgi:hypothetical protein
MRALYHGRPAESGVAEGGGGEEVTFYRDHE